MADEGRRISIYAGDSTTSIAFRHGHHPDTVWNHGENRELREKRDDKNVLTKGDSLFVPSLRIEEVSKPDAQRHRFRRRGVPERLVLRFLDEESEPEAGEPFSVHVGPVTHEGELDGNGELRVPIPPDARVAHVIVGEAGRIANLKVRVGRLDPIDTDDGVAQRLVSLGYLGQGDAKNRAAVRAAAERFKRDSGVAEDESDGSIRDALKKAFGY